MILRAIGAAAIALLQAGAVQAACSENSVVFRTDRGQTQFTVEIADDREEITRGLMHRESMPAKAGMLFVYPRPAPVAFWMRNTLIPLDMIFIGSDGVVRKVHENAVPLDETPIPGGNDIQYVLEINGGMAALLGIEAGAEMRHPAVDPAQAAWPCAE
ncbi:DUF192 domain-containing protein [Psychromarinibacter sp. S121]|uniref:DUF192 domain-containing protein n=1 Tax=Psychromarinibacter sp. S121 TaxID=3415127 RepID=UPI003C7D9BE4